MSQNAPYVLLVWEGSDDYFKRPRGCASVFWLTLLDQIDWVLAIKKNSGGYQPEENFQRKILKAQKDHFSEYLPSSEVINKVKGIQASNILANDKWVVPKDFKDVFWRLQYVTSMFGFVLYFKLPT